jgi:hypothetical protein
MTAKELVDAMRQYADERRDPDAPGHRLAQMVTAFAAFVVSDEDYNRVPPQEKSESITVTLWSDGRVTTDKDYEGPQTKEQAPPEPPKT